MKSSFYIICALMLLLHTEVSAQVIHIPVSLVNTEETIVGTYYAPGSCEAPTCIYEVTLYDSEGAPVLSKRYGMEDNAIEFNIQPASSFGTGVYYITCRPNGSNVPSAVKPIIILNPEDRDHLGILSSQIQFAATSTPSERLISSNQYAMDPLLQKEDVEVLSISIADLSQSPLLAFNEANSSEAYPQSNTFKIQGKAMSGNTPYANQLVGINALKDSLDFRYTTTDDEGYFEFTGYQFKGDRQFVINPYPNGVIDDFSVSLSQPARFAVTDIQVDSVALVEAIRLKLLSSKINQSFQKPSKKPVWDIYERVPLTTNNQLVQMSEYVQLPNMTRVFKEIVPFVMVKEEQLRVFSNEINRTLPLAPLLFLDGIPVSAETLLALDVAEVKYIEVINRRQELAPFGRLGLGGVVSVIRKETASALQLEPDNVDNQFVFQGLSKAEKFRQEERVQYKPYIPSIISWQTRIDTKSLSLDLPDVPTKLLVSIIYKEAEGSLRLKQEILSY